MLLVDCRYKMSEIVDIRGISHGPVISILNECLILFNHIWTNFLLYKRGYKSIHPNTSELKQQSKECFLRVNWGKQKKILMWVVKLTRSWQQFFGIHAVSTSLIFKSVEQSLGNVMCQLSRSFQ